MSARISLTMLNRHRVTASLPALPRTPGAVPSGLVAELNAEIDRYRRERDEAREQVEATKRVLVETSREVANANRERDEAREQLREAEATARLYQECEAELQEVHAVLVTAYGRDDLSEDTATVVEAMAAEWRRYHAALERCADEKHAGEAVTIAAAALEGGPACGDPGCCDGEPF